MALAGLLLVASLTAAVPAMAQTGGAAPPGGTTTPTAPTTPMAPGATAQLRPNGKALPPANAPRQIRKAIKAANRIHKKPYIWGGGHRRFKSKGYDCSGAVSYVLHAAGLLRSPMASGPLMSWGAPGTGSWITVYANRSHAWMTVAGLRFDTSSAGESFNQGSGPRWRASMRSGAGYAVRYFPGF
ncbi:MAG TPA: hypothetical protein VH501_02380 [Solirubrobacterales bacterium]